MEGADVVWAAISVAVDTIGVAGFASAIVLAASAVSDTANGSRKARFFMIPPKMS